MEMELPILKIVKDIAMKKYLWNKLNLWMNYQLIFRDQ